MHSKPGSSLPFAERLIGGTTEMKKHWNESVRKVRRWLINNSQVIYRGRVCGATKTLREGILSFLVQVVVGKGGGGRGWDNSASLILGCCRFQCSPPPPMAQDLAMYMSSHSPGLTSPCSRAGTS